MYQKRNDCWDKELEVISLFSGDYSKDLYLREISKLSKLPLKTTQNVLNNLENNGILKSHVRGKSKFFSLNLDNIQAKLYILQGEIYKTRVFLQKYPEFKSFLKELNLKYLVIVFGSFAKFKTNKDSDVDMMIVSEKQELPTHLLPHKIHQVNLLEKNFIASIDAKDTLLEEIKENHIILNNHSSFVDVMWNYYGRR